MSSLKEVVKRALLRIQKNGQIATPDLYKKVFCDEAKNLNITFDDCKDHWRDSFFKKLDPKIKNQMQNVPIKTQEDFIACLNSIALRSANVQSQKEQLLIYRDILSIFLHHYISSNPDNSKYLNLIRETKEFIEGNTQINAQQLKEKWSNVFKQKRQETPLGKEEREETLSFIAPLLRPSLIEHPKKQEAIDKASQMLKSDLSKIIKEQLILVLTKALQERIHIDKALLNATIRQHAKEIEKIAEVVMAKVSSMQIAGAMIVDEITQSNKQLTNLNPEEKKLLNFKENMLALLAHSQKRFKHIKEAIDNTKNGLEKISTKIGVEKPKKIEAQPHSLDTLTGVYTLPGAKELIQYQEDLFVEYHQSYSLFFIDIDHFKEINEKYGEGPGDKILATFGKLLKSIVRENDYVIRFDGEEFLVLLSGMDHFDSSYIAEKIRTQIEESTFVYGEYQMKITVTIGVADRNEGEGFDSITHIAQQRMRAGKEQGYNRVSC